MGYFANGSFGDSYITHVCENCAHFGDCAVWEAHMEFNHKKEQRPVLDMLIPRNGVYNSQCKMFLER